METNFWTIIRLLLLPEKLNTIIPFLFVISNEKSYTWSKIRLTIPCIESLRNWKVDRKNELLLSFRGEKELCEASVTKKRVH